MHKSHDYSPPKNLGHWAYSLHQINFGLTKDLAIHNLLSKNKKPSFRQGFKGMLLGRCNLTFPRAFKTMHLGQILCLSPSQ